VHCIKSTLNVSLIEGTDFIRKSEVTTAAMLIIHTSWTAWPWRWH